MSPFRRRSEGGFTLIEVMAAFGMFALLFGLMMQILSTSMGNTRRSGDYTQAAMWAQSKLDTLGLEEMIVPGDYRGRFDDRFSYQMEITEELQVADEGGSYLPEHICEPSAEELLGEILPKSVDIQIYRALLETSASEHAARMLAMDNATKACNDMIESLTLAYNKARQSSITAELMDIVGGAEALKG